MESVNFIRGYGKVNPSEDQTFQSPQKPIPKRKSNIISIISITLISTLIIGSIITALIIHKSNSNSNSSDSSASSTLNDKSSQLLKIVCNVTQQPDLCFSSIWPIYELLNKPKPGPIMFYNISLQVSITQLKNLSSLPKILIKEKNDPGTDSALKDCISLFDDSLSQFKNSLDQMKLVPGEVKTLTEMKISNMQTWMSAALTDQETCLDGLKEMDSKLVDGVEVRVHDTKMYMDNSLAILNNLKWLVEKLGFTMG